MTMKFFQPSKGAKIAAAAGTAVGALTGFQGAKAAREEQLTAQEAARLRIEQAKAALDREKFNLDVERQTLDMALQQRAAQKSMQEVRARYQALRVSGMTPEQIDGLRRVAAFQKRVGIPSPLGLIEGSDYTSLNTPENMAIFEKLSPEDRNQWMADVQAEQDEIRKRAEEKKIAGIAGKMMANQVITPEEGQQLIAGMLATGQNAEAERLLRAKLQEREGAAIPEIVRGQLMQRADKAITESTTYLDDSDSTRVMQLRWRMENDPFMDQKEMIRAVGEIEVLSAGPNAKAYVEGIAEKVALQARANAQPHGGGSFGRTGWGQTPPGGVTMPSRPENQLRPLGKLAQGDRVMFGNNVRRFALQIADQAMTPEQQDAAIRDYIRQLGVEASEQEIHALLDEIEGQEVKDEQAAALDKAKADAMSGRVTRDALEMQRMRREQVGALQ